MSLIENEIIRVATILVLLATVFWGGWIWRGATDQGELNALREKNEFLKGRDLDAVRLEDFIAKSDLAQMSSGGRYQLLFGNGSISARDDEFTGIIDSALQYIRGAEFPKAISKLSEAIKDLPDFPYAHFYLGIAERAHMPTRAKPHFERAHALFQGLLKIKPGNTEMRFYDAMTLTFLGHGDSATKQLYRVHKQNQTWARLGCGCNFLMIDSTSLSTNEMLVWDRFISALRSLKCDTVQATGSPHGSQFVNVVPPLPKLDWPKEIQYE